MMASGARAARSIMPAREECMEKCVRAVPEARIAKGGGGFMNKMMASGARAARSIMPAQKERACAMLESNGDCGLNFAAEAAPLPQLEANSMQLAQPEQQQQQQAEQQQQPAQQQQQQ